MCSCSIACYKPHKATHESGNDLGHTTHASQGTDAVQPPEIRSRAAFNLEDLASNAAFLDLMRRYPQLKTRLSDIYFGVRPKSAKPAGSNYQPPDSRRAKAMQDKSNENALRLMAWARKSDTLDGNGIKEFIALVASLTSQPQEEQG
jgi:hypothetical protein